MSRAAPLDNTIEIVTPENIAFHYRVAGPFRRLIAFGLDLVIGGIVLAIIGIFLMFTAPFLQAASLGVFIVLLFLFQWFYFGVFETYMNGQTPGKRIMGLRTLTLDGQPINGLQAVLRAILRSVDFMPPPTFMFGLICMSLNNRYQRLGDIVCGTMVVAEERRWFSGMARIEDARAARLAALLPTDFRISRTMSRAIATYVERRLNFTLAKRREIARHLGEPLIQKLRLAPDTSHDLLLCALYHRAFITDRGEQEEGSVAQPATEPQRQTAGTRA